MRARRRYNKQTCDTYAPYGNRWTVQQAHADDILFAFDDEDVKGMYDVRTYIAHDYEGVNLAIVEWIIRNGLPKFNLSFLTL